MKNIQLNTDSGMYYVRFAVNGKKYVSTLRTSDENVAVLRASEYIAAVKRGEDDPDLVWKSSKARTKRKKLEYSNRNTLDKLALSTLPVVMSNAEVIKTVESTDKDKAKFESTLTSEQQRFKEEIGKLLKVYDEQRDTETEPRSLEEIWGQCYRFQDTNDLVRAQMMQMSIIFQNTWEQFMEVCKVKETMLQDLAAKVSGKSLDDDERKKLEMLYSYERDRWMTEKRDSLRMIRDLAEISTTMAKEYRQCRTTQAYYFHISAIEQFKALVIAALHKSVHESNVLTEIGATIREGCLKIFMSNNRTE